MQGDTGRYKKHYCFLFLFLQGGESSPLKTPFFGEMIMEEKGKLIVFFVSRIGSGVPL